MSEGENHHHGKNEIIIVKRHGDHEGDHHSAAWKIAYADFMTAMMAFFLVMWLVNAANEKTQASVASYFNPIKLTDDKPADKSVKKPANSAEGEATQDKSKEQGQQQASGNGAESGKDEKTTAGEEAKYSEANFFENPYSVLSEIAQEVGHPARRPAPMAAKPIAIRSTLISGPSRWRSRRRRTPAARARPASRWRPRATTP
jgi:chemotaxis protein MotB